MSVGKPSQNVGIQGVQGVNSTGSQKINQKAARTSFFNGLPSLRNCFSGIARSLGLQSHAKVATEDPSIINTETTDLTGGVEMGSTARAGESIQATTEPVKEFQISGENASIIRDGQPDHNDLRESDFKAIGCAANKSIVDDQKKDVDDQKKDVDAQKKELDKNCKNIEENIMRRLQSETYPTDGGIESAKESAEFANLMCFKEAWTLLKGLPDAGLPVSKDVIKEQLQLKFIDNEKTILEGSTADGTSVVKNSLEDEGFINIVKTRVGYSKPKKGEDPTDIQDKLSKKAILTVKSEVKETQQPWCKKTDSYTDSSKIKHDFSIVPSNIEGQKHNETYGFKLTKRLCTGTTLKGCEQTKGKTDKGVPDELCNSNQRTYSKDGRSIAKAHTHAVATLPKDDGTDARLKAAKNKALQFLERAMEQELQANAVRNGGTINIDEANNMSLEVFSQSLMSAVQGGINVPTDQKEILDLLNDAETSKELLEDACKNIEISRPKGAALSAENMTCSSMMGQTGVNEGEYLSRGSHALRFNNELGSKLSASVEHANSSIDELLNKCDGDNAPTNVADLKASLHTDLKDPDKSTEEKKEIANQLKLLGTIGKTDNISELKTKLATKQTKLNKLLQAQQKEAFWAPLSLFTRRNAYKQPVLQLLIAQECGMSSNINCMSGKDRTGETWNQFALFANKLDSANNDSGIDKVIMQMDISSGGGFSQVVSYGESLFTTAEIEENLRFVEHTGGRHVTERNGYVNEYKNERKGAKWVPISGRNDVRENHMYGWTGRERTGCTSA
ncbi:MAG: hypothetical protein VXX85_00255 [Candidatus Margulisiibacteriota bacterium]|nr:hypothetical protein [Candidatus Margulisiibacteriota bacterium]